VDIKVYTYSSNNDVWKLSEYERTRVQIHRFFLDVFITP